MISQWYGLKPRAIKLRQDGLSIKIIEKRLKIPRSTLSGWFRLIRLSSQQEHKLEVNRRLGLVKAREKAVIWHNKQKENRLRLAEAEADKTLEQINLPHGSVSELALAMLYLGEGFKKSLDTGIGNSDPTILRFFVAMLLNFYRVEKNKITCQLHLRADQDPNMIKKYWSEKLGLPLAAFQAVSQDKRTKGRPTYPDYKGVCIVRCGHVAIQRKLVYLSKKFCERIIGQNQGLRA